MTDFYNWMSKNGGNGIVDIGVWQPTNPDPAQQHTGIRLLGTDYESGGVSGGVGKNGTRFPEYGSPPGWEKAKAGPADLSHVDIDLLARQHAARYRRAMVGPARLRAGRLDYRAGRRAGAGDRAALPLRGGWHGAGGAGVPGGRRARAHGRHPPGWHDRHFPEPVVPYPGHPGWWVGTRTNTVYNGDPLPTQAGGARGRGDGPAQWSSSRRARR